MAKLWILSDLHLETLPYPDNFRPDPPPFDVLVAAGDIWEGDPGRGFAVLRRLAGTKPVVCVMGNHEHWNGVVHEDLALARVLAAREGVSLLDGTGAVHAGCRFVGTTLWSDYRLAGALDPAAQTGEPIDVAHPGGSHLLTIGDAAALHRRARAALAGLIARADGTLPLVVVTHHAPHPDCIAPAQRGGWNAGNSASDLSALTDAGRAALWVHGHVHRSLDLTRPGGTRILCNPAGPGFANPAFDDALVVALD
ncbi:metallophosphoesterase [Methylobacterium sp. NEAU 140]|uniref:metallophosphoesterase n=1 Tax=Methylobacterium sp. NEAU 140 TaxID=3064945 RepID=UPI0027343D2E|nr:metallophosphoesterase [Methylobacterium sp. NEAU 140]MDP4024943.1 metallophosphoesterase [Methylobacterium sp. NEAU 140]